MSDTGRRWSLYVQDMIDSAQRVLEYTAGSSQAEFFASRLHVDATLRSLELIGEAATRIPAEVRRASTDVPWRMVIALRNRLIHGYLGLDEDTIWSVVKDDLPTLIVRLQALRSEAGDLA